MRKVICITYPTHTRSYPKYDNSELQAQHIAPTTGTALSRIRIIFLILMDFLTLLGYTRFRCNGFSASRFCFCFRHNLIFFVCIFIFIFDGVGQFWLLRPDGKQFGQVETLLDTFVFKIVVNYGLCFYHVNKDHYEKW